MPRRIRTITRSLTVWFLAMAAVLLFSQPASASPTASADEAVRSEGQVVRSEGQAVTTASRITTAPTSSAPATSGLTSEDMARSSSSASKWLWIIAPVAILGLWFGLNRLWRTPAVRS